MQATLKNVTPLTESIVSFSFETEKALRYTAGQFVEVTLPHTTMDSRGDKRWFTLSSSPDQALIRITTKFAASSGSSFKQALRTLPTGGTVTVSDPLGDFVLPKLTTVPLIFVAAGIGITPFVSMFESLIATGETRSIKFLYAVHSEDEIVFQELFDRANQHTTIVVTKPSAAWGGERGVLTAEMIFGLESPDPGALVYLAGPETFTSALASGLLATDLKKAQLVTDYFPNYASI